jgi:hypothetical protein
MTDAIHLFALASNNNNNNKKKRKQCQKIGEREKSKNGWERIEPNY